MFVRDIMSGHIQRRNTHTFDVFDINHRGLIIFQSVTLPLKCRFPRRPTQTLSKITQKVVNLSAEFLGSLPQPVSVELGSF